MKYLIGFLGLSLSLLAQPRLLVRSEQVVDEQRVVARDAFTPDNLVKIAEAFSLNWHSVPFAILVIGTDPDFRHYTGKGTADAVPLANYLYRLHVVFRDTIPPEWENLASVIKIGQTTTLRMRMGGQLFFAHLGSLKLPVSERCHCEVLHLASIAGRMEGEITGVHLFLRCGVVPSQKHVDTMAENLSRLWPLGVIRVSARTDSWFVEHPNFPFLYPFDSPVVMPTKEAYEHTSEVMGVHRP